MAFIIQLPQKPYAFSKQQRKINPAITRQVTNLHRKGYCSDFLINAEGYIFCLQDNQRYIKEQLTVELVDQSYDELSGTYQYIHKVETDSGEKGILMLQRIFFNTKALLFSDTEPG